VSLRTAAVLPAQNASAAAVAQTLRLLHVDSNIVHSSCQCLTSAAAAASAVVIVCCRVHHMKVST
jgi:hypothetical protein